MGKIPIYVLPKDVKICHTLYRGTDMTESIVDLIVQILRAYEEKSGMSCFSIAGEMGMEPSNYYLYREGDGNPTCKTVDKIFGVVLTHYPDIIEEILEKKLHELRAREQLLGMP